MKKLLDSELTPASRIASIVLLAFVFLRIVFEAYQRSRPRVFDVWSVGDWLINYDGGFVRRGLTGSLALLISRAIAQPPESVVFLFKLLAFSILYLAGARLVLRTRGLALSHLLMLLSPMVLLFPFVDLQGGGRKEILLLALAWSLGGSSAGKALAAAGYSGLAVLGLLLTAVHEGLFLFLPLLFFCVSVMHADQNWRVGRLVLALVPSLLLFVFHALSGPVSADTLDAMTRGVDARYAECWRWGAIKALGDSPADALRAVALVGRTMFRDRGMGPLLLFGAAVLAAVAPTLFSVFSEFPALLRDPSSRRAGGLLLVCLAVQLPLFIATIDWGRWICVDLSLLAAAFLAFRSRAQDERGGSAGPVRPPARRATMVSTGLQILVVSVYVSTWGVRHCPLWDAWLGSEGSALTRLRFETFAPQCGSPPTCSSCVE